jgi:hypothetical protein
MEHTPNNDRTRMQTISVLHGSGKRHAAETLCSRTTGTTPIAF